MGLLDLLTGRKARRMRVLVCGHPTLRRRSEPVPALTPEIRELTSRMVVTMFENEVVGVGLAAPQVGVNLRLITLATHDPAKPVPPESSPGELLLGPRMPLALVNPEVLWSSADREAREEGCLSVPEVSALVERPVRIVVRATTLDGEVVQLECGGLLGRCIQHEVDHLDGILFIDRLADEDRVALTPQIEALARGTRARGLRAEAVTAATAATAGEASG